MKNLLKHFLGLILLGSFLFVGFAFAGCDEGSPQWQCLLAGKTNCEQLEEQYLSGKSVPEESVGVCIGLKEVETEEQCQKAEQGLKNSSYDHGASKLTGQWAVETCKCRFDLPETAGLKGSLLDLSRVCRAKTSLPVRRAEAI